MRIALPFATILFAACSSADLRPVDAGPAIALGGDIIDGEVVVSADLPASLQEELGLSQLDFDADLGAGLYLADDEVNLMAIQAALKQDFDGAIAENNLAASAFSTNDPYRSLQWNFDMIGVDAAWAWNKGAGITVAVIDTGVSEAGEDTPIHLVNGIDYVNGGTPNDENGHGTHVAGTIAQATDNGKGVAGIAPEATILAIRALDANGGGSMYNVAKAITSAVNSGADVINMSLGTSSSMSTVATAVADAVARGVVVVAASGNEYRSTVSYPAAYPGVIAVGAVGGDRAVAAYSNGGTALDVVAPGGNMALDANRDGYADGVLQETFEGGSWGYNFFEGTSMASPHVAAVAALLLAEGADPQGVEQILRDTATDIGTAGFDTRAGYGLITPSAALASIDGSAPPAEEDEPSTTPPATADTTAPVISGVTGWRSGSSMEISWTTNELATTEIEFETYGWFGDTTADATSHAQSFTISSSTTYWFTIIAKDAAGNAAESGLWVMYP
jgi:serine protease